MCTNLNNLLQQLTIPINFINKLPININAIYRWLKIFARSRTLWSEGSDIKEILFGSRCIDVQTTSSSLDLTSFIFQMEDSLPPYSTSAYLSWNVSAGLEVTSYVITVTCLNGRDDGDDEVSYDEDASPTFKVFKSQAALREECRKGLRCLAIGLFNWNSCN